MSDNCCGVLFPKRDAVSPEDTEGCILPNGHMSPHKFLTAGGRVFRWATDLSCDCESCMSDEPDDWCIDYWEASDE